jgi:hypothetical protein
VDEKPGVSEVRPLTVEDVRRICRALFEAEARNVLIGDFAVIMHGGERTTKVLDLLVDPDAGYVARLKRALSILEDNAARDIAPNDL